MKSTADIAKRLELVRGRLQKGAFASSLGVNVKTVSRWEAGEAVPDGSSLLVLAERYGVDPTWVLTGEAHRSSAQDPNVGSDAHQARLRQAASGVNIGFTATPKAVPGVDSYVTVPRYELRASAGSGSRAELQEVEPSGSFAFRRDLMRQTLGREGDGFAAVLVAGDSMEPTLRDGEEIVVDLQAADYHRRDGIYLIALDGDLRVKRLRLTMNGSVEVWGDNPAYRPEVLQPDAAAELRVLGRVVWPRVR